GVAPSAALCCSSGCSHPAGGIQTVVVHPSGLSWVHVLVQVKPGSGSAPVPGKGAGGPSGSAADRQDQSDTSVIDTSTWLTRAAVLSCSGGSPRQVQVCTPPSSSWTM